MTCLPVQSPCTSACCVTRTVKQTNATRVKRSSQRSSTSSRNTVAKHVRLLEERGLIVTEHTTVITKQGVKRNGNLLYTLLPIHEVTERFYERQLCALDESATRSRVQARLVRQPDA